MEKARSPSLRVCTSKSISKGTPCLNAFVLFSWGCRLNTANSPQPKLQNVRLDSGSKGMPLQSGRAHCGSLGVGL
eukprot:6483768-Amphidinium_carterae.1